MPVNDHGQQRTNLAEHVTTRDVGTLGEAVLEQWAAENGITANKARRDVTGWDYLLEFPPSSAPHVTGAVDLEGPAAQCFVQVKSSDRSGRSWPIKLSNWKRMIEAPMPSFFLVLHFDNSSHPQRAFLVHVDGDLMRHVLLELRKRSAKAPRERRLNKINSMLRWGVGSELTPPSSLRFVAAVRHHIGSSFADYVRKKQELLSTAGYETGKWAFESELVIPHTTTEDREQALIDFALGVSEGLQISPGAKLWDERFGIRAPKPVRTFESHGRIKVHAGKKMQVRLRSKDGFSSLNLDAELFGTGPISQFIKPESHQLRLQTTYCDFFLRLPDKFDAKLKFPELNERHDLDQLLDFARLIELLKAMDQHSVYFEAHGEGKPRLQGQLTANQKLRKEFSEFGDSVVAAWRIARDYGLPFPLGVSRHQLWHQRSHITLMDKVLRSDLADCRISFNALGSTLPSSAVCMPAILFAWLGESLVGMSVAFTGNLSEARKVDDARRHEMAGVSATIIRRISGDGNQPRHSAADLLTEVRKSFEETHVMILPEGAP